MSSQMITRLSLGGFVPFLRCEECGEWCGAYRVAFDANEDLGDQKICDECFADPAFNWRSPEEPNITIHADNFEITIDAMRQIDADRVWEICDAAAHAEGRPLTVVEGWRFVTNIAVFDRLVAAAHGLVVATHRSQQRGLAVWFSETHDLMAAAIAEEEEFVQVCDYDGLEGVYEPPFDEPQVVS